MSLTCTKGVDEILDYGADWTAWLAGDTIAGSTWDVPNGLTKGADTASTTGTVVWLSGGTAYTSYAVVNRITTAGGRTAERTISVHVVPASGRTD